MKRALKDLGVKQLEKRLDIYFSKFIRLRDSDENGITKCCTCEKYKFWKGKYLGDTEGADCGHYSKRNRAHRFTEKNCNAQCKGCNSDKKGKGEADLHALYIDSKYGTGTAIGLRESENIIIKHPREWYIMKMEHYKEKGKKLAKEKGQEY